MIIKNESFTSVVYTNYIIIQIKILNKFKNIIAIITNLGTIFFK